MTFGPGPGRAMLKDRDHPSRQIYLEMFADRDGSRLLKRFFKTYGGHGPEETLRLLVHQIRRTETRLAVVFRSVRPDATPAAFGAFMARGAFWVIIDQECIVRVLIRISWTHCECRSVWGE